MKKFFCLLLITVLALSCAKKPVELRSGIWRGILLTKDSSKIPFNFEVKYEGNSSVIEIITGSERMRVDSLERRGDSLFVEMPLFGTRFELLLTNDEMRGELVRSKYRMPFVAYPDQPYRFASKISPDSVSVQGRWLVTLDSDTIIGEFVEEKGVVTGSFLTPTGDYRFFEGIHTDEGKLSLSCFDGGFIRLFTADVTGKDTIKNITMHSGYEGISTGSAERKEDAQLPDAYSITGLKNGYKTLGFSFPDSDGNMVALTDESLKGKVVILQISGSWCPNCFDESVFLADMWNKYNPSIDVLCLSFERSEDFQKARIEAMRLKSTAKIPYRMLITGKTPSQVKDALPELDNFKSFPTTIVIDKKGIVRKIHSGFSGPGTGVHYRSFVKEFTALIEELIKEK
ncbi:MAG: TlpA disulfide reductase family protein [Rikenellaceae bacterium]|nr:TlpA disulfide reductase family protein [Rikenellaceae bacterium]